MFSNKRLSLRFDQAAIDRFFQSVNGDAVTRLQAGKHLHLFPVGSSALNESIRHDPAIIDRIDPGQLPFFHHRPLGNQKDLFSAFRDKHPSEKA